MRMMTYSLHPTIDEDDNYDDYCNVEITTMPKYYYQSIVIKII